MPRTRKPALDPEWVTRKVTETRAAQGLPPTITDPLVYDQIALLMAPWLDEQHPHGDAGARPAA